MGTNDNNIIPTDWLSLTITKKASHIAEDGTLKASIAGQRGAHLIELLPEDNDAPWGTKGDDLYSKVQLSCQIDVKGRLSIDEREGIKGLVELTVVVEEWRLVTSLSPVLDDSRLKQGSLKITEQERTTPTKRSIVSTNSTEITFKRSKSTEHPSTLIHPSPLSQDVVSVPPLQQPWPTLSVFQPPQAVLPSFLPHTIRPRPSRMRITDAFHFDGKGYCRPPSNGAGTAAFPRDFDGLYAFEQAFSDGRRRIVRIAVNAQAEESVDAMVVYEDWR